MPSSVKKRTYEDVPGEPVKSFFVEMLTRDISLADAILDLLDNCVDGVLRKAPPSPNNETPYRGYYAEINYDQSKFEIIDNCGGIPWDLHEYAFRMGSTGPKRDPGLPTVGVYGIGMKRAIFKIGKDCLIQTQNNADAYDVEISPTWLKDENTWKIPVRPSSSRTKEDGTTIYISEIHEGVKALFGPDKALFDQEFHKKVSTHYAFIINKGFTVKINGVTIKPKPTKLRFDSGQSKRAIRPFMYQTHIEGVDVFLAVGFTHPIPSEAEVAAEQEHKQRSMLDAGWTIICNDRAVVYCDRSELTGWGEAGVPKYHTQFIAISGIVEFRSNDASLLPTTTTKRGVDASSRLYLQVKNKMREGLRMFTDFTNKWKGRELVHQAQEKIKNADPKALGQLKELYSSSAVKSTAVRGGPGGSQYKPSLPMPAQADHRDRRISFVRDTESIEDVSSYLFGDTDVDPSTVGKKCFDLQLEEARK